VANPSEGSEQELKELLEEVRALRRDLEELRSRPDFRPDYAVLARTQGELSPEYAVLVREARPSYAVLARSEAVLEGPSYEVLVRPARPGGEEGSAPGR
jgi:hypothetical protein